MLSQPVLQFLSTSIADEDDERLRLDEVIAIQHSHYSTLHHTFIFAKSLLDLVGADPHASHLEHVIATPLIEEVTRSVLDVDITCLQPLTKNCLLRQLTLAPIKGTDRIAFHHQHPWLASRHVPPFLVGDPYLIALDHGATTVQADIMHAVRDKDMAGLR